MFRQIGPTEIILILLVIVLLFGAKKLPELARGSGRALRIFKAETKGLLDDDDDVKESEKTEAQKQLDAQHRAEAAARIRTESGATVTREAPVDATYVAPAQASVPTPTPVQASVPTPAQTPVDRTPDVER